MPQAVALHFLGVDRGQAKDGNCTQAIDLVCRCCPLHVWQTASLLVRFLPSISAGYR